MRTVRFLEKRTFERVGLPVVTYEAGSVHTLKDDHARRWVTRGAAEYVATELVVDPHDGVPVLNVVLPITPVAVPTDHSAEEVKLHDEPVASAPAVAGQDGGDLGVGAVHEPQRGRGRTTVRRSGNRSQ